MRSEKSKVLGALLPSESCHNEFEAIFNIPKTWLIHFIWRFVSLRGFSLCLKKKLLGLYAILNILRGKVAYASALT